MKRKITLSIANRKIYLTAIAALLFVAAVVGVTKIASVSAQPGQRTAVTLLGPSGVTAGQAARLSFFNPSRDPVRVSLVLLDSKGSILVNQEFTAQPRSLVKYEWDFNFMAADPSGRAEVAGAVRVTGRGIGNASIPGLASLQVFNVVDGKTQTVAFGTGWSWDLDNDGVN